jgi:acetyl esterase/lipase
MTRRRATLVVLAVVTALGVSSCRYVDPDFGFVKTADVVYGDGINENGELEQLKLDLYTPSGDTATDRPVVIWAHGGGFRMGDKMSGGAWAREFAMRGYVGASINYRMDEDAGEIRHPLDAYEMQRIFWAVSDMKAAIRWFRANAASLGVDPNRIAVAGASAGAVMALSTAVTHDEPGDTGDNPGFSSAVCTAISVSGATEPTLVDVGDAGAIFFHGETDTVVPTNLAYATRDAMIDAGLPTEFHLFEGEGHGIAGPHRPEILSAIYPWLRTHLVRAPAPCL